MDLDKKIDLYVDGLKLDQFDINFGIKIDGYTFNPSIFKKSGTKNYLDYCKKILEKTKNNPVSFEVIADDEGNIIKQAKILSGLSNSVYVKVPIVYTNGKLTYNVIKNLSNENIKMNITAIFTIEQIKNILEPINATKNILSVFAGRIYDAGYDAFSRVKEINEFVKSNSSCRVLWASPRMSYDYIAAIKSKTDIITMQPEQILKMKKFGKDLEQFSIETANQFYKDAKTSGYKI